MDDQLRRLQLTQLEILEVVDQICRDHNLAYSLYAGTLLGAVRHKGFIPWDDDLDICMPREDYDRFIEYWMQNPVEGYILQNKENSPAFTQSFTKVRKANTAFLESETARGKYHTGIFVDIFPIDRIPNGRIARYLFWWRCMRYQLYTREFVPPKSGVLIRMISGFMLAFTGKDRREYVRKRLLEKITSNNMNRMLATVMIETVDSMRMTFSHALFDDVVELEFEGKGFCAFADWDAYLRTKYGNYMQLPPESERIWKHHPILIDFERELQQQGEANR